ncbi:MAG: hypothetical protein HY868_05250 [Chloroflexi bacterium]|nr:hypothetical protein [Chloroflexota bacterium]
MSKLGYILTKRTMQSNPPCGGGGLSPLFPALRAVEQADAADSVSLASRLDLAADPPPR